MKHLIFLILLMPIVAFSQVEDSFEKANLAFERSKFDEAFIHLKTSLNADVNHLPSKILMGKVLALSFIYDDAILEFYEALEKGADPNLIIEFLANSLLVENRYEKLISLSDRGLTDKNRAILYAIQAKAFNELEDKEKASALFLSAVKLSPSNASIADAFAKYELENNNLPAAQQLAEQAINVDSTYTEAYRTLAAVYRNLGNTDAYVQTLSQALLIDEQQPLILRDLVSAYVNLNQFQNAENTINKILVNSPQDPMAKFMLSYVQSKLGKTDDAKATLEQLVNSLSLLDSDSLNRGHGMLYISGIANYASGNINAAMQDLRSYIIKQPEDIQASIILSDIYTQERSFASAISVLERFTQEAETDLNFGSRLCRLYLQTNLDHKCNRLIEKLAVQFSTNPDFISLKARALAARGREDEALEALQSIDEVSELLLLDRAMLAIQAKQYALAKEQALLLLNNYSDNNDYKNLLASIYMRQSDNNQAKSILEEILTSNPEHFSARFNLSSVYANLGELQRAKEILIVLLAERPEQADVSLMLAKIENRLSNYEQALAHLDTVLLFSPNSIEAQLEMATTYANLNDLNRAIKIINPIVKDNFLDPTYLSFRADLHIRSENFAAAQSDLTTLYGIYSDDFSALYNLALFQERARDSEGAWKSIERSLVLNPESYPIQLEKVRIALKVGKLQEAKNTLLALKKRHGSSPDWYMLNGDLAQAEKDLDSAADFYQMAITVDANFTQALFKRYLLASNGYATEEFITYIEGAVDETPASDLKRHLLGDLYLDRKNYNKAKEQYAFIVKNNTYERIPFVFNNFANIHIIEGNAESAYELSRKAYSLLPNNQSVLDTLGWSLTKLGKYDEGLKYLRQSFAMNTVDPAVRYHLGYTLFKLNRNIEAKRELENLLEQFDEFDYRQDAVALIATINASS